MTQKVIVKKSGISGKGLFANTNFSKGQIVYIIKGRIIKGDLKYTAYPNSIGISRHVWLDVFKPGRYLNHSCKPNTGIKGKVTLVALRDIKKGEELTFDYSITEDSDWRMRCKCGAKNCRKILKAIRFLPKKTYRAYLPYIPTYFQKAYKRYNGT